MSRVLSLLASLLVLTASMWGASVGVVEATSGNAVLTHGTTTAAPGPNAPLENNDIVRTGAGGSVRVVLTDGSALLMSQNSELRVVTHNTETQTTLIELLHGHVRALTTAVTKAGGRFQINTPTAQVVALGTALALLGWTRSRNWRGLGPYTRFWTPPVP